MYAIRINVGRTSDIIDMESFDFDKVAEEIGCEWIVPANVYVNNKHYVVLCDEEGLRKKDFTYTGFRGGINPFTGRVNVEPFVNSFLIVKSRKYNGTYKYVGLNEKDIELLSERIMVVADPNRGHGDQVFMNLTGISNEDLAKEMR